MGREVRRTPMPEVLGYQMFETTSGEGSAISPVKTTPEELACWLVDNKASAFGDMTASYEEWLATINAGGSCGSLLIAPGKGIVSGVAATKLLEDKKAPTK